MLKLNEKNELLMQEKEEIISYNESVQSTNEKLMKNLVELTKENKRLEKHYEKVNLNYQNDFIREEKEENESLKKDLRKFLNNAEMVSPSKKPLINEDNVRNIIYLEKEIVQLNNQYQELYNQAFYLFHLNFIIDEKKKFIINYLLSNQNLILINLFKLFKFKFLKFINKIY